MYVLDDVCMRAYVFCVCMRMYAYTFNVLCMYTCVYYVSCMYVIVYACMYVFN